MRYFKRTVSMIIALMIVILSACSSLCAYAEAEKPGLNVVIVYDCSYSMHYGEDEYDEELMCLDAATMLINMCDARYSQIAVVPFVYTTLAGHVVRGEHSWDYGYYNKWLDVSDAYTRAALCDEMMRYFPNQQVIQGYTNHAEGMRAAYDLVQQVQGNGNKTMVLVLADSELNGNAANGAKLDDAASIAAEEARAIEYAEQIKALGGVIYCMDMGPYSEEPLLKRLAGNNQDAHSDKSKYYWSNVRAEDLKARFSGVFADMIGSKQDVAAANISATDITFGIRVPNNSVSEVNVVLELEKTKGIDSISVTNPDGAAVAPGNDLLKYSNGNGGPAGYDYVSLKIIDPSDGVWTIGAGRGDSVRDDERFTVDLLYNYEIELKSFVQEQKQTYYKLDSVPLCGSVYQPERNCQRRFGSVSRFFRRGSCDRSGNQYL